MPAYAHGRPPPHPTMPQAILPSRDKVLLEFTRQPCDPIAREYFETQGLTQAAALECNALAARTPVSVGRTCYLYIQDAQNRFRTRIKLKGAAGLEAMCLKETGEKTIGVRAPAPLTPYNADRKILHLGFDPKAAPLTLTLIPEAPKAYMSLTQQGAEREYDCMARLSKLGLAEVPIFAAQRIRMSPGDQGKVPEFDYQGRTTGVTASLFPFESRFVFDYLQFALFAVGERLIMFREEAARETHTLGDDPLSVLSSAIDIYSRVARAKRDSIIEGLVARHNGGPNNFILHKGRDVRLADLDSALTLETVDRSQWGAHMLRDFTRDLMRALQYITFAAGNDIIFSKLQDDSLPLFKPILQGFYGDLATPDALQHAANEVRDAYLALIAAHRDSIAQIQDSHFLVQIGDLHRSVVEALYQRASKLLCPLHTDVFAALYNLQRSSTVLCQRGFSLPDLGKTGEELKQHFRAGVTAFGRTL